MNKTFHTATNNQKMNTHEQIAIFEEFLNYTFQLVQYSYWYGEKQRLIQVSKEKNGEEVIHRDSYGVEQMTFQYVVDKCANGDENFVLKIWYTKMIFTDDWFGHWVNIHHPDCGLNEGNMRYFYDNMGGIIALRHTLGIEYDIELK